MTDAVTPLVPPSDSGTAAPVEVVEVSPDENVAELHRELKKQMREPFSRALQRILKFRPTADALQKFANKSPDRWAQAVAILANLAGYEKGINITVNNRKDVGAMTDSELLAEHYATGRLLQARAQGPVREVKDAEIVHTLPAPVTPHE